GRGEKQPDKSAYFEESRREGHRKIGLAGTGRPGCKNEVVTLQRCEISALRRRARRDEALPRADLLRLWTLVAGLRTFGRFIGARMADCADHLADPDHLALRQTAI